jgi:hypothetical protein
MRRAFTGLPKYTSSAAPGFSESGALGARASGAHGSPIKRVGEGAAARPIELPRLLAIWRTTYEHSK